MSSQKTPADKGPRRPGTEVPVAPPMGLGMESKPKGILEVEAKGEFAKLADPLNEIPDDLEIRVDDVLRDSRVAEVLESFDRELVALKQVKRRIREIAALLLIERLRRSINLEAEPPTLHMCFTGNPGTGKTTVGMMMGKILFKLGYVRKGHLVAAGREDLVGQYVGHTAPKTREVVKRAMGGVLFIDEAYNLYRLDNERDYGQEAVELLLQLMENERDNLVVIMAGYKDKMERFFSDVPGIRSRIAHHIDFPDYSLEELIQIGALMQKKQRYRFSPKAEKAFEKLLKQGISHPGFANGRSVRNALDHARLRQAIRLFNTAERGGKLTKADLVTIEEADVLEIRAFAEGIPAADRGSSDLARADERRPDFKGSGTPGD